MPGWEWKNEQAERFVIMPGFQREVVTLGSSDWMVEGLSGCGCASIQRLCLLLGCMCALLHGNASCWGVST